MKCKFTFTLVEIILVMVLLSTILGLAAPSLSKFSSSTQLKDTAQQMVALSRYAQQLAISKSKTIDFWVDLENQSYGVKPTFEEVLTDDFEKKYELPSRQKFVFDLNETPQTTFYADGTYESNFETFNIEDAQGALVYFSWELTRPSLKISLEAE